MQKLCLVALSAAIAVPSLTAQRGGGSNPEKVWAFLLEKHDSDGDGRIQKSEYSRGADKFARYDKNSDGVLTEADFPKSKGRRGRSQRFVKMMSATIVTVADSDKNGGVTTAEWKIFTKTVTAEDGSLDVEALVAKLPEPASRRQGGGRQGGGRQGDGRQGDGKDGGRQSGRRQGRGGFRLNARMLKRMLDLDNSGELDAPDMESIFAGLDSDKDGTVSKKELAKVRGSRGTSKRPPEKIPKVGEVAPDFDLPTQADPQKTVKLSSFAGNKPVALIFGSYT